MIQRVPWRHRLTPSQSNPTTNCLSCKGFKNSSGSSFAAVTIWIGTEATGTSSGGLSTAINEEKYLKLQTDDMVTRDA